MKKSRLSEEQVVTILREGRGMKVKEDCAKHGTDKRSLDPEREVCWKKSWVSELRVDDFS